MTRSSQLCRHNFDIFRIVIPSLADLSIDEKLAKLAKNARECELRFA